MLRSQLDSLARNYIINRPEPGREEVPVFPMTTDEQARVIPITVRRCPFCSTKMKQHMHQIRTWQFEGKSPKFILTMLKRKGAAPIDPTISDIVRTPQRFDEMLGMHMIQCISESHNSYSHHWREVQDAISVQQELKQRIAEVRGDLSDFEVLDHEFSNSSTSYEIVSHDVNSVPVVDLSNVNDMPLQDMMSEILLSHVQCVLIEHRRYMQDIAAGHNPTPPSLNGLNKVLENFTKLFGEFQVAELMDKIPGIKNILESDVEAA